MKKSKLSALTSFRLGSGALMVLLGAGALAFAESAHAADAAGPGCDPTRRTVAYHAGSILGAAVETSHHAVPCAVVSDTTIDSAPVAVFPDGTVVSAPETTAATGIPPAVTISHDNGATWNVQNLTLQPNTTSTALWMNVNSGTNRIWVAPIGPNPGNCPGITSVAEVTWSDDEGLTWHSPPGDPASCRQLNGGQSVIEGPAPIDQPQPVGYPNVVYECGQVSDGAIPLSVHCWKSLDGGQTWSLFQGPNNPPPDCTGKYGGRGKAVGPDGTLYMAIECTPAAGGVTVGGPGPLYLASSSDEGNTWYYQFVTNTSYYNTDAVLLVTSLAVDQEGNLYIAWVNAQNQPMLIVGKGAAWPSSPMNIAQPGVNFVTRVAVAVKSPGQIALAYTGSTGGIFGGFNGYITESWDALSTNPTFIGASVNDPSQPLMSSAYAENISSNKGRIWTLTPVFGPDGSVWAGFHCANFTTGVTTGVPAASITCPGGAAAPSAAPLALGVVGRLAAIPATATHDFNGDGNSDILWRNTAGNVGMWLMNGSTIESSSILGNVTNTWSIVGQRDFSGDGDADILWRDNAGNVGIWLMNGGSIVSSTVLGNVPTNWSVVGTGNFDGTGLGDVLWRDSQGNVGIWFMNGAAVTEASVVGNMSTNWFIAGVDNHGDIFWRNSATGEIGMWVMDGTSITKSADFGAVPLTWSIAGIGDFDGNGSTDILWRDTSGNVGIWLMNGTNLMSTATLGNVGLNWSVAETGDYGGAGRSDILWIDKLGNVASWVMNGTTVSSVANYGNVGTTWNVQSLNAD
jgi:FG-GAP-like repeat